MYVLFIWFTIGGAMPLSAVALSAEFVGAESCINAAKAINTTYDGRYTKYWVCAPKNTYLTNLPTHSGRFLP